MSTYFHLACLECSEYVWVGQEGMAGTTFYSGETKTMHALGAFLFTHKYHRLEFTNEHDERDLEDVTELLSSLPNADWNTVPREILFPTDKAKQED